MYDTLETVLVVAIVFGTFAWMMRLILEFRTRSRLIDRGLVDENVRHLYISQRDTGIFTMKLGIVLTAIGAAFFIGELFPYYVSQEMTIAFMFLFAGLGLLLTYWIRPKKQDNGHPQGPTA